ncbi:type VI secretion protein [Methylocaldum sp. BRCS4]|jgi:type IV secretion system protein VirB3|nr:type VI secretion protein [Methylocaldum sp. BRCS4]
MNSAEQEQEMVEPLYKGLTRPPMILGVTDSYAVICMVIVVTIYVGAKSMLWALATAPALWLFGYLVCLKDPRSFDIWIAKSRYFMKCRRRSAWGGNSYDPF